MTVSRAVLRPQRVEEIAEIVRDTTSGLRIRGAGTWMQAGAPGQATHELHLDALAGIRAYTPGDLTISVGAATTLAELDAVTRAHGQWCPLLPWGDDDGTVGATLATATTGPFADALGRPRDLALGLECVDGHGRIIRAGGRVVKNVAGFDLTRLMIGSWGTLGVITEVHLRLRARPSVDVTWLIERSTTAGIQDFVRGSIPPLAAVRLPESVTRTLGGATASAWLVRVGGNAARVAAAQASLAALGDCTEVSSEAWNIVRPALAPDAAATRWHWTPLMRRVQRAFDPRGVLNAGLIVEQAA
jgi:glycolate oxidase FAD binding subunit